MLKISFQSFAAFSSDYALKSIQFRTEIAYSQSRKKCDYLSQFSNLTMKASYFVWRTTMFGEFYFESVSVRRAYKFKKSFLAFVLARAREFLDLRPSKKNRFNSGLYAILESIVDYSTNITLKTHQFFFQWRFTHFQENSHNWVKLAISECSYAFFSHYGSIGHPTIGP